MDPIEPLKELRIEDAHGPNGRLSFSLPRWAVFFLIVGGIGFNGWNIWNIKSWITLHEVAEKATAEAIDARVAAIQTRQTEAGRVMAEFVSEANGAISDLRDDALVNRMMMRQHYPATADAIEDLVNEARKRRTPK